ncbi:MAG: hypothetical protein ACRD0A_16185 [Acidimicrobiales bacterium]
MSTVPPSELGELRADLTTFRGEFGHFQITVATALGQIADHLGRIETTLNTLVDTLAAHISDGHGAQD